MATHPPSDPLSGAPAPRRRNPRGTRERLVRAALDLFTAHGYHETTTPLIARRAGVAEGTIYRHFQSKEHLLNEIFRAGVRTFTQAVTDTRPAAACAERLEGVAAAWRDLAGQDPALVRMVIGRRFTGVLDERSRQAVADLGAEVTRVIASGKAAGSVRPGPAEVWAEVWYRLVTLMLERVAARDWKPDDRSAQLVVQAAWAAIAQPAAAGQAGSGQ